MKRKEITIAIVVSLVLHLLILLLSLKMPALFPSDTPDAIELFVANPNNGWQIADIPDSINNEKPEKSKFLGLQNQRVQQETVAKSFKRETGNGQKPGKGPKSDVSGRKDSGGWKQEQTKNDQNEMVEKKAGKYKEYDKDIFAMKTRSRNSGNEVADRLGGGGTPSLPEDYYPDFKFGEHTYLNVLRYPDVEYFVRLKRIFKTTWDPVTALRQDMQATSISRGSVSVILGVSVDRNGSLAELFVLKGSGLENYDREAVRTIRASSPFAAPPSKFVKEDGYLRMSWTFTVYM